MRLRLRSKLLIGVNCNVDHYILQQSVNGVAFGNVTLPAPDPTKAPAISITLNLTPSPTNNSSPATSLAWVSTLGPDRVKAQVQIDGQTVATVDLYAPTETDAQIVWSINGLAPNVNHSIQIV